MLLSYILEYDWSIRSRLTVYVFFCVPDELNAYS